MVATCCLDGALRLWDARTGNMVSEYRGHMAEILDFTTNRYDGDDGDHIGGGDALSVELWS